MMKGALAGFIGGIAGSGAKALAERVFPPRLDNQTSPPVVLAEKATGHPLSAAGRTAAEQGIHWLFGGLIGAAYGSAVEFEPAAGSWGGAAFGLAVKRMTHENLLPRMGLDAPRPQQSIQERVSEWTTHVVYGVTTELVRRIARNRL